MMMSNNFLASAIRISQRGNNNNNDNNNTILQFTFVAPKHYLPQALYNISMLKMT